MIKWPPVESHTLVAFTAAVCVTVSVWGAGPRGFIFFEATDITDEHGEHFLSENRSLANPNEIIKNILCEVISTVRTIILGRV